MKKLAVLVGINYPGTDHELRGCVNDVKIMKNLLTSHYGFKSEHITTLTDHEATTAAIIGALEHMVATCEPGDNIFFHYSGHGSQLYDANNDESDGLDEVLCPVDLDWISKIIRDDDLKRIFDKTPNGVHLTVVLDCCHSGTGLDHDESYQPAEVRTRDVAVVDELKRYLPPPKEMMVPNVSRSWHKTSTTHSISRSINKAGILLSGCRADQKSTDTFLEGRSVGAFTHFLTKVLRDHNFNITYKALIDGVNEQLARNGFSQRPELNGPSGLYDHPFIVGRVEGELVTEYKRASSVKDTLYSWWSTMKHFVTVTAPYWIKCFFTTTLPSWFKKGQ